MISKPGRVLGVDACRAGWVGVVLTADGMFVEAIARASVETLVEAVLTTWSVAVVGIDIPIGLPDGSGRDADRLARGLVGGRASSVFSPPTRQSLDAGSWDAALAAQIAATGKGLSKQAYGLCGWILEVDAWLPRARCQVVEIHPEVSFRAMNGQPLSHGKKTWAGMHERLTLLHHRGIDLPSDLDPTGAGQAAPDDIVDAAAAAWTASRVHAGTAERLPGHNEPQIFGGVDAAIWC